MTSTSELDLGIPGRQVLFVELEGVARERPAGALLVIDVDGFYRINREHGHEVGDTVLREIVQVLQTAMPPAAALFRLGGDEFVVLLAPPCTLREAAECAEHLREQVASAAYGEMRIRLSVTIGVAVPPSGPNWGARDWLALADDRMTAAKKSAADRSRVNCVNADALPFHWGEARIRYLGWPALG